ncbi:hypothetical protein BpHYR1_016537 [Brachionus plicatilis]|uniref:Uncharacterized protein n=1 Tax=Brachionus plicatilis TaxID=10195 RepID=A0A3M7PSR0_BRAPC|nr:hypothetical protein BpHYR1_016537 [Brachionus plicatilis]
MSSVMENFIMGSTIYSEFCPDLADSAKKIKIGGEIALRIYTIIIETKRIQLQNNNLRSKTSNSDKNWMQRNHVWLKSSFMQDTACTFMQRFCLVEENLLSFHLSAIFFNIFKILNFGKFFHANFNLVTNIFNDTANLHALTWDKKKITFSSFSLEAVPLRLKTPSTWLTVFGQTKNYFTLEWREFVHLYLSKSFRDFSIPRRILCPPQSSDCRGSSSVNRSEPSYC